jgi:hypothetical protein
MGAVDFQTRTIRAMSMNEAYREAVSEAEFESGHDPYNGTISTTTNFRDVTTMFKNSGQSLNEFIEANIEKVGKWNSWGICLKEPKADYKAKVEVRHEMQKGTRKWETLYVIYDTYGKDEVGRKAKKVDAMKMAKEFVQRHDKSCFIFIEKRTNSSIVAQLNPVRKQNDKRGEYVFFGLAGC